jgi:hypothetical protein
MTQPATVTVKPQMVASYNGLFPYKGIIIRERQTPHNRRTDGSHGRFPSVMAGRTTKTGGLRSCG